MTDLSIGKPVAIIGLGNPEPRFMRTRHNIGFQIIDELARSHGASWQQKPKYEAASITLDDTQVLLIKPLTYMNNSGDVVPFLKKNGIKPEETLVLHDELELPFGKIALKVGGSAKGHNGLKSLIQAFGTDAFARLRFGIGRPAEKEAVPSYVLSSFEKPIEVEGLVGQAVMMIEKVYSRTH